MQSNGSARRDGLKWKIKQKQNNGNVLQAYKHASMKCECTLVFLSSLIYGDGIE